MSEASVEWAPRTANYKADSLLANGETHGFDPSRRIEVDVNTPQVGDSPGRTSHGSADGRGHEDHACNRDIHKSSEGATKTEARGQDEGEESVVRPT